MKSLIFARIGLRLSLTYLLVISTIFATFSVGVRILYYHVLHQKIIDRLTLIAESAIDDIELDKDRLTFDRKLIDLHRIRSNIPVLIPEHKLELFDRQECGSQISRGNSDWRHRYQVESKIRSLGIDTGAHAAA